MERKLSPAANRVLRGLKAFERKHGRSPSVRELAVETRRSSTAVQYQLDRLVKWGVVARDPGQPRTVRVAA